MIEQINMPDRMMFATDYPHWDFDAPDQAFPVRLDADFKQAIMAGNAQKLYQF